MPDLLQVRPDPGSYFTTTSIMSRPAGHSPESLRRSAPAITISCRNSAAVISSGLGPGAFGTPDDSLIRRSSPGFTFRGVAAKVGCNNGFTTGMRAT